MIGVMAVLSVVVSCRRSSGVSEQGIRISCDTKLGVDEHNAARNDSGSGWVAQATGDTLLVMRTGPCGDHCTYTDELVFVDIHENCPRLLRATTTRRDRAAPKAIDAETGALGIQDWDLERGVVSGRLAAEWEVTFYAIIPKEHR